MDKGGIAMSQGPEKPAGMQVEKLDTSSLEEQNDAIRELAYNMLDTSEGHSYAERKGELGGLRKSYLDSGEHGELFVLKKNDKVVGFMAVKKDPSTKEATVEQLRLAGPGEDGASIRSLLGFAVSTLADEMYHHIVVDASKPDGNLEHIIAASFAPTVELKKHEDATETLAA